MHCLVEFGNGFYEGEWRSGKREGLGVFMWDSGTVYIGKNTLFYENTLWDI